MGKMGVHATLRSFGMTTPPIQTLQRPTIERSSTTSLNSVKQEIQRFDNQYAPWG